MRLYLLSLTPTKMETPALKNSVDRLYKSVFEKSKDAICFTGRSGNLIEFNKSTLTLLGYSAREFSKLNLKNIFADAEEVKRIEKFMSGSEEITDREVSLISKDGGKITCLLNLIKEKDPITNEEIFIVIMKDITGQKKDEADLRNAEKLAVTSRVARTIAHEVRNPLTNVNLSVEQLKNEIESKDETDLYFDIITRNCERINNLITELLNATKPAPIATSKHSLNEIAEQAISQLQDKINEKGINIQRHYTKDNSEVNVDAPKVKQAIVNVILNAIEAVNAKTGEINIRTIAQTDKCLLQISDNGGGLSKDNIHRIFEPFYSTRQNSKGLGLTGTQNIVLTHKGNIEVESEEGKGTTLTLSFNHE